MTGYARIYYYRLEDYRNTPDYLYGLYEGQVVAGEPSGFGRYIHGLKDKSFVGYFKDFRASAVGLGLLYKDEALYKSGIFMDDQAIFDDGKENPKIELVFNKFDD